MSIDGDRVGRERSSRWPFGDHDRRRPGGPMGVLLERWSHGRPVGFSRVVPTVIWLAFVIFPLVDAFVSKGSTIDRVIAIGAAAVFVAAYVGLLFIVFDPVKRLRSWLLVGVLLAVAFGLTAFRADGWGFLFSYSAACAALVAPSAWGFGAVIGCTALAAVATLIGGGGAGTASGWGASAIGVGLLLVLMRDLRMRNQELSEARAELAQTAVAQERERFARDLHDLLGHSLSVIAIKAELAGRLMPDRPGQAAIEVAELEQVARQALSEVRLAVSGYRQPTLDGELAGARMALSAAGIETVVAGDSIEGLAPAVEAVLAWAVREGATNVIRHSNARVCTLRLGLAGDVASVEVVDDGGGCAGGSSEGNGLAGLRERTDGVGGSVVAQSLPGGGGFRLLVSVPVAVVAPRRAPGDAAFGREGVRR